MRVPLAKAGSLLKVSSFAVSAISDDAAHYALSLGLSLECASMEGVIRLTDGTSVRLPTSLLRWVKDPPATAGRQLAVLPCYLDNSRSSVLFTVALPAAEDESLLSQRGVCLRAA